MKKLVIIGCGNMGSVIIDSLLEKRLFKAEELVVVEKIPNAATERLGRLNVTIFDDIDEIDFVIQTVILAVKPQNSVSVINQLSGKVTARSLVISIMAGTTLGTMTEAFKGAQVIRCMPNTPCAIKEGMSVFCGNAHVSSESYDFVKTIFDSFGLSLQVLDEAMIDAATAISGSGPAYLFYLAECLKEGAIQLGFTDQQADTLAVQTIYGSASLMKRTGESPADLREKVTSPGGTTEAALNFFYDQDLKNTLLDGFRAAFDRSIELRKT